MAWLTSFYHFPFKKTFEWALLLPCAFPSYILAYVYYYHKDKFIELNPYLAAIVIMSFAFYPYVYLFSKQAFQEISPSLIHAAKVLKNSNLKTFWKIILPLSQPAIFSGLLLVCMEVMGDFGTVDFFSIDTLATGIYRTWFGLGSLNGAIQVAFILFIFIICIVVLENHFRKKKRFYQQHIPHAQETGKKLAGFSAIAASVICFIPIFLAFILPLSILLSNIYSLGAKAFDEDFFTISARSFILAASAAFLCLFIGFFIAIIRQFNHNSLINILSKSISFGYAIPGSILAIIVLNTLSIFDNLFSNTYLYIFKEEYPTLIFSGTVLSLFYAYSMKFTSVSLQSSQASMTKISPSLFWASRLLGSTTCKTSFKIYLPIIKKSLFVAFILIFVDIIKELPATMVLRPFNFETIAIKTYNLASDERLIEASPVALLIVLLGIIPVIILANIQPKNKE
ncbi:iron ABC transporter permease [Fluviispira sanaruensis]|uniref:Iron ABC transporter permease n=1 Tax=Fluviispira sanaruensis TaxID=2493639 RepID=A0A4P2VJM4_FLUSA|nr:iron ABC transporter permease [Fluviispira sanaruensis]